MDELWFARLARANSLILLRNSQMFRIFSLISSLGNSARKHCSAAVTCREGGFRSPEIAKFPVKFPDTRQFVWRPVRSALHRQQGIPRFREFLSLVAERPANGGLF
jgi:hypothetical protein